MESEAVVRFSGSTGPITLRAQLKALQTAEIIAAKFGFFDIDLIDNDPGRFTVVASAAKRTLTAKGQTLEQAVERLLGMLVDGS